MIINQPPPEIYAQRPVRSDFARRSSGGDLNVRKVALLGIGLIILSGVGYFLYSGSMETSGEEGVVPTIAAEETLKERPEQPGGIDIPHQDVAVFQQLNGSDAPQAGSAVEHLLPEPEQPLPQGEGVTPTQDASGDVIPPAETEESPVTDARDELAHAGETMPAAKEIGAAAEPQKVVMEKTLEAPRPSVEQETLTQSISSTVKKAQEEEKAAPAAVALAPAKIEEKVVAKTVEAAKPAPVKTTVTKTPAKAVTANDKKAEEAMAHLPEELFTDKNYKPAVSAASTEKTVSAPVTKTATQAQTTSGSTRLQLASLTDQAAAQKAAQKMQSQYAGILGGTQLGVTRADLGAKGVYYRVTSSGVSDAKAKSLCADIKKAKGACVILR